MPISVTTGLPIGGTSNGVDKSILATIQAVAPLIGLDVPEAVFSASDREHIELQSLANTTARSIVNEHDWQAMKAVATLTGDGSTISFPFPEDFDRMEPNGRLYSSTRAGPLTFVETDDEWLSLDHPGSSLLDGLWRFNGTGVDVRPPLANGATIKFNYRTAAYAFDLSGYYKIEFQDDLDEFRLDIELLRLGMIWRWKASKGFPYAEDMANYERRRERLIFADRGAKTMATIRRGSWGNIAYPYPLGQ